MKATLVMLAVTHMKTGVCIAGVRADAPDVWVRPVREFDSVLLGDITYPPAPGISSPGQPAARRVMRPLDLVEFTLLHARPDPPHIEDWTCDFAHARPRLLGTMPEGERAALLAAATAPPEDVWARHTRSLGALAVDELTATFTYDGYTGKLEARLAFPGMPSGVASIPCTDLKWRALGRRLLAERGRPTGQGDIRTLALTGNGLWDALGGARRCWLAMGVARAYHGTVWPLIVGVHTLPEYEADVDFTNL